MDRPLLEKIASQVKPIMVKRNWTVGVLAEVRPGLSGDGFRIEWLTTSSFPLTLRFWVSRVTNADGQKSMGK